MKKLLILMILFAFVVGVPGSVLAKKKKDKEDIKLTSASQFCEANGNLGYSSLGDCIDIFLTTYGPGNSGPVGVCKEFLNKDPEQFYERYNNLDECVNFLRTGYVHE